MISNRSLTDLASRCRYCGSQGHVVHVGPSVEATCDSCGSCTETFDTSDQAARAWERGDYAPDLTGPYG